MEYLFCAALKKSGDLHDAEDLTQEVLLAALQYPKKIENVRAWLSTVLNHKYYDMLRRKYKLPTVRIDLVPEEMEPWEMQESDDRPDDTAVRREIAYLADKYRTVIVRHYMYGEKVQDIADSLGIPKGTVLSRLSSGREQMRRRLEKMESYEQLSYQPERLFVSCHGRQGLHDEPWSLVADDLMKQNILILAYQKPLTVVEIANALGIPTAYIESAVQDLTTSELMSKTGSNQYFTDFLIIKPEQKLKALDAEIQLVQTHYGELLQGVRDYRNELQKADFWSQLAEEKRKKLEYYFLLHLFSSALYTVSRRIVPSDEKYPQRPGGGAWIAEGSQYPRNFDFESYRPGKYCYGGERRAYWENYMNARSIELRVYDIQPDLNRYEHGPVEIHDDDLARLLYIISREIPFECTGFNLMFLQDIPHLTDCGILENIHQKPVVSIPMITPEEYKQLDKIRVVHMHRFVDMLEPWLREVFPMMRIEIPGHLVGRIAEFRQYSCYAIPMAFIKEATERGDFEPKDATPPMVLVIDDKNPAIR